MVVTINLPFPFDTATDIQYIFLPISPQFFKNVKDIIWASTRKNLSGRFSVNKGADQPAHLCRLISAFGIPYLEPIISKHATGEIF